MKGAAVVFVLILLAMFFFFNFTSLSVCFSCSVYACPEAENPTGCYRVHLPDGEWCHSYHQVSRGYYSSLT